MKIRDEALIIGLAAGLISGLMVLFVGEAIYYAKGGNSFGVVFNSLMFVLAVLVVYFGLVRGRLRDWQLGEIK